MRIAELTGARTQISHLAAVGKRNWGRVRDVLAMAGPRAGFDACPYLAGNAPLSQLLPDHVGIDIPNNPVVRQRVEVVWRDNPVPSSRPTGSRSTRTARPAAASRARVRSGHFHEL